MSPYRILGLVEDATEPEIKRAYARLLKQCRPDEDPEGFQHLHETYALCLAITQARSSSLPATKVNRWPERDSAYSPAAEPSQQSGDAEDAGAGAPKPPTEPSPEAPQHVFLASEPATHPAHEPDGAPHRPQRAEPAFQPHAFLDELTRQANQATAPDLLDWLHAHPALYSLDAKDALADPLVHHLCARPALPPEHLRALLRFFDLDTINPRAQRLQAHIERLYRRSAEASGDWGDVAYMYEEPRSSTGSKAGGIYWPWALLVFLLIRVVLAVMHD